MPIPRHLRFSFAASGSVGGLIGNGVGYFLLLYYSQVLGLDPALAGLAMMIALFVDAVSDPWIGRWSDRLRHRLGRRHPFLFAAIIPVPVAYYLLWDVPELSQTPLFFYMVGLTVLLRVSLTVHVVPFSALLPELASDYDARTRLMSDTYSSAWFSGTLVSVAMYAWWLADTPAYPDGSGILRAEGYVSAGSVSAVAIFFCLAFAAFATRRHIPTLAEPPAAVGMGEAFVQLGVTLGERSVLAVVASGLFAAMATGTSAALWAYMQSYFWGFGSRQITGMLSAQLVSALIAFALVPILTRGREKKHVLIALSLIATVIVTGPVFLSVNGYFFATDGQWLYPVMLLLGVIEVTLWVMIGTLVASMIADTTEHRAVATERREEGLLLSAQSFIGKVAGGVGVWSGGLMLAAISFPTNTASADIGQDIINRLGWLYAPTLAAFYLASVWALSFYRIDRQTHARNLSSLRGEIAP